MAGQRADLRVTADGKSAPHPSSTPPQRRRTGHRHRHAQRAPSARCAASSAGAPAASRAEHPIVVFGCEVRRASTCWLPPDVAPFSLMCAGAAVTLRRICAARRAAAVKLVAGRRETGLRVPPRPALGARRLAGEREPHLRAGAARARRHRLGRRRRQKPPCTFSDPPARAPACRASRTSRPWMSARPPSPAAWIGRVAL